MENTTLSKRTVSYGIALAVACIINAIVVVAKEKSDAVMNSMKKVLGHHWTTHSAIIIVLFFALGGLLGMARGGLGIAITTNRLISTLVSATLVAALIIVGFYLFID
jgi:hypothetical protein